MRVDHSRHVLSLSAAANAQVPVPSNSSVPPKANKAGATQANGQKSPPAKGASTITPKDQASTSSEGTTQTTPKTLTQKTAASKQLPSADGDYVPCKFTPPELARLISPEKAPQLTAADEEELKGSVTSEAATQKDDPLLKGQVLNSFLSKLDGDTLAGLTPSQALNHVIADLSESESRALDKVTDQDVDELAETILTYLTPRQIPPPEGQKKEFDQDMPAIASFGAFLKTKAAGVVGVVNFGDLPTASANAIGKWEDTWKSLGETHAESVARIRSAIGAATPINSETIIDAARNSLQLLSRPSDVGCAMSILSYKETDIAYGFRIAREYIAVQIVVRNLNKDKPFVVHDAEFEVNTDLSGSSGRFFSGRDKVIVRALSSAQSSFDPRALVVHAAEATGAIMSASVPIFNVATFTNASAVFNGAFVPGLDKYWKDQTADQLNLLNDTGFSSQSNSQTVVPQLGTVLFVIFVPSKQFQEDWWTLPCVEKTYVGSTGKPTNQSTNRSLSSEDIGRALEACQSSNAVPVEDTGKKMSPPNTGETTSTKKMTAAEIIPRSQRHWWKLWYRPEDHQVQEISSIEGGKDVFRNAYPVPYRSWSPTALQLFADLSSTVVSGTHVTEETQLQSSISGLICSQSDPKSGDVQFPTPDTGLLDCKLTGKNLDKIAELRLRNAKDKPGTMDTTTAEGTVVVSGDSSKATVSFKTADLHSLMQPAYNVFAVTGSGVEQATSMTLHFSTEPFLSSVSPSSLDLTNNKVQTLTVDGYHFENVDSIVLTDKKTLTHVVVPVPADELKKDTQLQVSLDPAKLDLSQFGSKVELEVTVTVAKKASGNSTTLTFTGPAKAPVGGNKAPIVAKKAPTKPGQKAAKKP